MSDARQTKRAHLEWARPRLSSYQAATRAGYNATEDFLFATWLAFYAAFPSDFVDPDHTDFSLHLHWRYRGAIEVRRLMVATATWAAFIDAKKITPSPSGCGGGSAPPPHDDDADDIDPPTASAGSPAVSAGSPAVSAASPAASAAGDAADTCEEATEARGASYTDSASQEPTGDRDTTSSENPYLPLLRGDGDSLAVSQGLRLPSLFSRLLPPPITFKFGGYLQQQEYPQTPINTPALEVNLPPIPSLLPSLLPAISIPTLSYPDSDDDEVQVVSPQATLKPAAFAQAADGQAVYRSNSSPKKVSRMAPNYTVRDKYPAVTRGVRLHIKPKDARRMSVNSMGVSMTARTGLNALASVAADLSRDQVVEMSRAAIFAPFPPPPFPSTSNASALVPVKRPFPNHCGISSPPKRPRPSV